MDTMRIAVIGIGDFGGAIARSLTRRGAEVLAIDSHISTIESIADDVAFCVALDATDRKALKAQEIDKFDAVVVAIGQDFEQRLLVVAQCMELGVKRIMARAAGKNQRLILEKLGVSEILMPEEEVGSVVAERLLIPTLVSYLQLPDNYRIAEVLTPPKVVGRTIGDLDMRDRYRLSLVTLKMEDTKNSVKGQKLKYHVAGVPESKTVILDTDHLVLFGTQADIQRFIDINT